MPDDLFKLKSNDSGGYFAMALRAIGQDLAELFPQQIELYYQNETFDVRVRCDRKRAEKKTPAAAKSGLKNVIHKLATYRLDKAADGTDIAVFEHHYNSEEIGRLDRGGIHRRSQAGKVPDINNLGEALRTIGRIVDAQGGQLVRILKDPRRIVFDYKDKQGTSHNKEMTRSELFKVQQSYYEKRSGSGGVDPWKGQDWRR
ncbi:MAG TPA: hypothetical protein VFY96_10385 [Candidatus Binatia bacterium]|nr:hypothetical protein [Candidatus Binatia bacterium]